MMQSLLKQSIKAAIAAGEGILEIYNDSESDFSVEVKSDNSPLTIADRRSHEIIMEMLSNTGFPILSEEGSIVPFRERKDWEVLWIVDPLDGTKEFIKRNDEFTVNIALVENGTPVLGVIYVPVTRLLYYGARGEGSFKVVVNPDEEIDTNLLKAQQLPLPVKPEKFTIVASRSHMSPETELFIEQMRQKYGDTDLATSGSSLKICIVAEGSAHVYPRFAPTMEWDTAAGHAIALYAGRNIFQAKSNEPLQYNKEQLVNPWFVVE